ncbi:MAG: AsmA family protein, partial [Cyanobacteriota bacterium erpe_2018_sw_21hr_WHONDRS-SW48-000092_B_bin.40]|nr:AsmA family protein [Cyanobacteriota bacterium erpe_2018_sw_21hr_WHONDRS-SW48-000092_B_bin.40]
MVETKQLEERVKAEALMRPRWLIVRFLAGWLFSVAVLFILALMINIDWAKPKLEATMGEALHRNVHLGHLRWHFGLNGITVLTRSLKIDELDGTPFIAAKGSNIGVAFTPLLSGKLIVKFVQVDHPVIYAVKLKPGAWNFEDLLLQTIDVKFIQADSGTIHISDRSKTAISKEIVTLKNVDLKLNWPAKGKSMPFYLSFNTEAEGDQKPGYVRIDGLGKAVDKSFEHTNYALTVFATNIQAPEIKKILAVVADDQRLKDALDAKSQNVMVKGILALKAIVQGSVNTGFSADLNTQVEDVIISSKDMGQVKTKHASSGGSLQMTDSLIGWKDLDLTFGLLNVKTNGELRNWQDKKTKYDFTANSNLNDLGNISKSIDVSKLDLGSKEADQLVHVIKTATLTGKAFFDIKMSGVETQSKILSKLKAEGLSVQEVVKEVAPELGPYLALTGIGANSVITGNFETLPGRRLLIKDGQITVPDSAIKISGELDLLKDAFDLNIDVDKLSLKKAWAAALKDPKARAAISTRIRRTDLNTLFVDGMVRASGNIKGNSRTQRMTADVKAHLENGGFATADHTLNANSISGDCIINGETLQFNNVLGKVGATGKFTLTGGAVKLFTPRPDINLTLRGTNVNFENLSTIMNLFELKFPAVTDQHLTGKVKDLLIKLTGTPEKPQVYMSASPDDIAYRPPGLTRPIRAVSGNILYEHDNVTLTDVGIISRGMRLTTSIRIDDLSHAAVLRRVHVKSDGIEIGDIDYYLSSPVLPTPLRTAYKNLLDTYKI